MANFSTEFPIDSKNTIETVLRLACKWISGSPHSKIQEPDLQQLPINSEVTFGIEDEQVNISHVHSGDSEIGGLRYIRMDKGLQWTTSIVTLKTEDRHLLSIQVICEAMNTAARLPPPKKPYFIRQALDELGGGYDGEIPVTDKPFRLSANEESIAAALILGTAKNTLPIIYVSAGFHEGHLVDPDELAKFVSGMAHVVVEPSRAFSYKMKGLTASKNVFGGTVGVYWPKTHARNSYFIDENTPNARSLQLELAKDIRIALSNRRQVTQCTWTNLKEAVARNRFEQLKLKGSTELQDYIKAFDTDIAAQQDRITEAEEEIGRLTAEIRRLSIVTQSSADGLLRRGDEQDLFEHEITDIIIEALAEASRSVREGSRREHVLQDLIAANTHSGARQGLEQEIKAVLKTYQEMNAKTKSALVRLGFDITEDGKHYKAVFQGDGRYTFPISKSGSDHRTGKNLTSDINNKLF